MRNKLSKFAAFLLLASGLAFGQTTSTITGTIRDLTQALVTSGKVTFALAPSRDTTISGYSRFSPNTVTCTITSLGLIKALDGISACTVTMNTALQPVGSYYIVSVWPYNVQTSQFTFYAVLSTYDWSTVVPTPTTSPAQNFVDIFSSQSIGGNKTWLGSQVFSGTFTLAGALAANGGLTSVGEQIQVSGTGCTDVLDLYNIDTGPTFPHKYLRVNRTTGALEFVNSGCSSVLASISEGAGVPFLQIGGSAQYGINFIIAAPLNSYSVNAGNGGSPGVPGQAVILNGGAAVGPTGTASGGPVVLNSGTQCITGWCTSPTAAGLQSNTTFGTYNNISTVGNGVPSEVATVDLLAQSAAVATTTLYTVPSGGAAITAAGEVGTLVTVYTSVIPPAGSLVDVAGMTPSGYNGTSLFVSSNTSTSFSYLASSGLGTVTAYGSWSTALGIPYRVSWDSKITQAATTSSTLGALTIVYTDPDGTVVTVTAPASVVAGTIATTSAGNTTGTALLGMPLTLNCKPGTAITYAFAYASSGATIMNYNLHVRLESL